MQVSNLWIYTTDITQFMQKNKCLLTEVCPNSIGIHGTLENSFAVMTEYLLLENNTISCHTATDQQKQTLHYRCHNM
jgi:hypothetical protein